MRNEKTSSKRRTKLIADIVTYIGLAIYFLILVLPFIIIIITSFASDYEISHSIGFVWAPKFSTEGYEVLFKNDPYAVGGVPSILRGFLNTLWMTTIPTVVGLLVSGAAAFALVVLLMRFIYKMQSSGTFQPEKLVGRRATVYVSVPEKRSGRGKITLNAQGKFMELDAMTDGERLSVDDPVEIVATENECMLVARAAENDEEKEVK